MRPPNRTSPPPSRAVSPSSRTPPASNVIRPLIASSECGSEKCRMRPPVIDALPENTGLSSGPWTSAASSASPELRMSRKNPCRMPRFASPVACSAIWRSASPTVPLTSSRVSSPTSRICSTCTTCWSSEQADRAVVPQRVVEQPHVDAVDGAVDQQVIDVAQLADDADAAAGDGGRERRQPRLEGAHVRVERGVGERGTSARRRTPASARCGPSPTPTAAATPRRARPS